jgi:hypothetical protein
LNDLEGKIRVEEMLGRCGVLMQVFFDRIGSPPRTLQFEGDVVVEHEGDDVEEDEFVVVEKPIVPYAHTLTPEELQELLTLTQI